jgi:hypothetical protein
MKLYALALAAVVAGVLFVGVFAIHTRSPRITCANFDRIRNGMTRAQVESIVGPPGDFTTGRLVFDPGSIPWPPISRCSGETVLEWTADTGWGLVRFNHDETVNGALFYPGFLHEQSTYENVRWRIERQWRRWFEPAGAARVSIPPPPPPMPRRPASFNGNGLE